MSESLIRQWLDLWHELLGDPEIPRFGEPDDMRGVLADFRRQPELLARAFAPLPEGEAILARLQRCLDAEPSPDGIYLVHTTAPISETEAVALTQDALGRGCEACGIEVPPYPIHVHHREMTLDEESDATFLVEELGDLVIGMSYDGRGEKSAAMQFLHETLYTLAASFEVQGYCLTPLFRPECATWTRMRHSWSCGWPV